jgi:protein involved in polysaccharide export with SLBB domain
MISIRSILILFIFITGCTEMKPRRTPSTSHSEVSSPSKELDLKRPQWADGDQGILKEGFLLKIACDQDEKLNGEFRINKRGNLILPYGVELKASGLRLEDLIQVLRRKYAEYLVNPHIAVNVQEESYYVNVLGLVNNPAAVLVSNEASLEEVINLAGGPLLNKGGAPAASYAVIKQDDVSHQLNLLEYLRGADTLTQGLDYPKWQGGESITLKAVSSGKAKESDNNSVKILGQVEQPGEYPYLKGADLHHYLIKAGGPNSGADLTRIALLRARDSGNSTSRETFDIEDESPEIYAGDTIMLYPESDSTLGKKARVLGGFGGVLSAIAAIAIAIFSF